MNGPERNGLPQGVRAVADQDGSPARKYATQPDLWGSRYTSGDKELREFRKCSPSFSAVDNLGYADENERGPEDFIKAIKSEQLDGLEGV